MSKAKSEFPTDPALAMVAVSSTRLPGVASILTACGLKPGGQKGWLASLFGGKTSDDQKWDDDKLVFSFRGGHIAVSLMPAPIPWSDVEGPCQTAWWWPEATERMRPHPYHILVAVLGGEIEPVERRVLLAKIVRAVVRESDAVGVYWGEGTLVHEPSEFVAQSASLNPRDIPGRLWIDVRVERNDDGTFRCFTTGLNPLGFHEIEVRSSAIPPDELVGFIGDTACYIVNNRIQIPDGDTMGRTETEKYKVIYGPSMFDRETVMQLAMT